MGTTLADFISRTAVCSGPDVIAWTEENAHALCAWGIAENGGISQGNGAHWNPWDSTLYVPGAWPFNSFGPGGTEHVFNYPDEMKGIFAFLATLHQGWVPSYAPIRAALAAGHAPWAVERAVGASVWGTGHFASVLAEVLANPGPYMGRMVGGS